jgi:hypothetical protein
VALIAADLDGDGDIDLAGAASIAERIALFFQTAPGVFAAAPGALLFGRCPVHGTTTTLVVASCAAAGAAVVSFLRLVEREQTVP